MKVAHSLSQNHVDDTLRNLGPRLLKEPWKSLWTPERPTTGYCYIVSEALFHYGDQGPCWKPACLRTPATHWYLQCGDRILDFTANQFDFRPSYGRGHHRAFLQGSVRTPKGWISKRGHKMASLLELV